jgi:hypothetical protein
MLRKSLQITLHDSRYMLAQTFWHGQPSGQIQFEFHKGFAYQAVAVRLRVVRWSRAEDCSLRDAAMHKTACSPTQTFFGL